MWQILRNTLMKTTTKLSTTKYASPFFLKSRQLEIKELVNREAQYIWAKNMDLSLKERNEYYKKLGEDYLDSKKRIKGRDLLKYEMCLQIK